MFTILLLSQSAQAGWVAQTCTRMFDRLVADDPYQYEEVMTSALVYYYEQYGIKGAWGKLEERDATQMNVLGGELRSRLSRVMKQFETPENIERITQALETYSEHEGQAQYVKGGAQ